MKDSTISSRFAAQSTYIHPDTHTRSPTRGIVIYPNYSSTVRIVNGEKLKETIQIVLHDTRNIQGDSKRK